MAQIDQLSIELTADISKAEKEINKLSKDLSALEKQLVSLNTKNLTAIGQAVSNLGSGMQKLKGISEKHFENLANSINKLASVNASEITKTASAISQLSSAFNSTAFMTNQSANVASMADAVRKFGYSTVPQAITNMPLLANALKQMMQTLSTSPTVSRNLIEMTNALANLATASKGVTKQTAPNVTNGFSKIRAGAKKLISSLKSLGHHLSRTKNSFKGLASYFGKFYATYFLVIRGIKSLGESIKKSMEYVETYNYFNVAFNEVGKASADGMVEGYRDRLKELNKKMTGYTIGENGELFGSGEIGLGLDAEQLMNYQARIMAVTNSVGLLGDVSVDTAEGLSMLASDLSSLTNTDLEDVMGNLQSGLIGQSRALYKYGIDITNATLGEYALANNITKSVSAMSQSEKMQLRMVAILEQSRVAWTDQATTINTVANQYRILGQQTSNLSRILGNLFLPVVKTVLPFVNGLVVALQNLLSYLGFAIWGDNWLKDLLDGTSNGYDGGLEEIADDLEESADSAKKLKSYLMGIDELNVLSESDGSSGSAGGSVDLSGTISSLLEEYRTAWQDAIDSSDNLANRYAKSIEKALKPLFDLIDLLSKGKFFDAGRLISTTITDSLNSINWDTVFTAFDDFGSSLAQYMNGRISPDLFRSVGKTIASGIKSGIVGASAFTSTFEWRGLGQSIASGINGFSETFPWSEMIELAGDLGTGLSDAITKTFEDTNLENLGNILYSGLISVIDFAFNLLNVDNVDKWITSITDTLTTVFEKMNIAREVNGQMVTGWEEIGTIFSTAVNKIIDFIEKLPWGELLKGVWDAIATAGINFFEEHPIVATLSILLPSIGVLYPSMFLFGTNLGKIMSSAIGFYFLGNRIATLLFPDDKKWYDYCLEHPIEAFKKAWDSFSDGTWKDAVKLMWDDFCQYTKDYFAGKSFWDILGISFDEEIWGNSKLKKEGSTSGGHGFATGGYPEKSSLFWAGENGVPEILGTVGGRTAVAGGAEITGISDTIVQTSNRESVLLSEAVSLLKTIADKDLTIGDREIAKANRRGNRSLGMQIITTG